MIHIIEDDLSQLDMVDLIAVHLRGMAEIAPPESVHALDMDALKAPDVTLWAVRDNGYLLGCGALKELDPTHGEIKSMRTHDDHRRKGVGPLLLEHIIKTARRRGYQRLSLETGPEKGFAAARALYERYGFEYCGPFANYRYDPHSTFMSLAL